MADNGMAALKAIAAKKRNAGGTVASQLGGKKTAPSSGNSAMAGAIARRLAKGSSKSSASDNDSDDL